MRFTVATADLKSALALCSTVLASTAPREEDVLTTCYIFQTAGKDRLLIEATDRDLVAQMSIPAKIETDEPIRFGIEGSRLSSALGYTHEPELVFELQSGTESDEPHVRVYFGKDFVPYRYQATDEFLAVNRLIEGAKKDHTFSAAQLAGMLVYCRTFMGDSSSKPSFRVAEIRDRQFQSSDVKMIGAFKADYLDGNFRVSKDNIQKYLSFLNTVKEEQVVVMHNNDYFYLTTESGMLFGGKKPTNRLPEFQPPDPFKTEETIQFIVNKSELLAAIGIMSTGISQASTRIGMSLTDSTGDTFMTLGATSDTGNIKYSRAVSIQRLDSTGVADISFDYVRFFTAMSVMPEQFCISMTQRGNYLKFSADANVGTADAPVLEKRVAMQSNLA